MDLSIALSTLVSPAVLAFLLGALAVAIRSDLRVPEALTSALSMYLLLAIGLKGGVALRSTELGTMVLPLAVGIGFGIIIPIVVFGLLRVLTPYDSPHRGAIAAHYGSTSLVTFSAALTALGAAGIAAPGYAATLLTALEIPGILVGLALAHRSRGLRSWPATLHELLAGTSVLLLTGGLAIGALIGEAGYAPISPFFTDGFKGALVLFLLALGVQAAQRIGSLRHGAVGLIGFAVVFPLVVVTAATALGAVLGFGVGGAVVLGVLCASASYIAAPAAVRLALPEVNLALPLTASLSVTFPVNLVLGIPLSFVIAQGIA